MIYLAPSVLSADLLKLSEQVKEVEQNGADYIHVDIMDGHFVPNITFGPNIVSTLRRITNLPLDVHLMISEPDKYIESFAKAGAGIITVHQETCKHLHRTIQFIKNNGVKAGVSLNPATDISTILPVVEELDLILLMTVNPGFGGQKFINLVIPKISEFANIKQNNNFKYLIEIDGGINPETAKLVAEAGAEVLVAGNAIFNQPAIGQACKNIKDAALSAIK